MYLTLLTINDRLVNIKRGDLDITLFQNSLTSGDYMGPLYQKNYNINTLLYNNYDFNCIYNEGKKIPEYCYKGFKTYQIVLKKARDNKYHFSEITNFE